MRRAVDSFLAAKAISDLGFALDYIAINTFVWVRTGSPLATGAVVATLYAGGMLGGKLSHRLGDRWDRRRAMAGADLGRMAMLLALAALPPRWEVAWLFPAVFAVGVGRAVFESTLGASLPALAGDRLQSLNGLVSGLKGVALVVGMTLAAFATRALGFRSMFTIDAVTYGLSAWALLALPLRFREGAAGPDGSDAGARAGGSADGARANGDGARAAVRLRAASVAVPLLGTLLVVRALDAFGSGAQHVGLPILGSMLDPSDPARALGLIWGTWAAGTIAGSFLLRPVLSSVLARAHATSTAFLAATICMSAGFVGVFWLSSWPARLAAAAVAGLGDSISEIAFRLSLQRAPDEVRGGLFGLAELVVYSGFIVGMLAVGAAVTPGTIRLWVVALHGVPVLAAALAIVVAVRLGRRPASAPGRVGRADAGAGQVGAGRVGAGRAGAEAGQGTWRT